MPSISLVALVFSAISNLETMCAAMAGARGFGTEPTLGPRGAWVRPYTGGVYVIMIFNFDGLHVDALLPYTSG